MNPILIRYRKHNVKIIKQTRYIGEIFLVIQNVLIFCVFLVHLHVCCDLFCFCLNAKHIITLLYHFYHDIACFAEFKDVMMWIFVTIFFWFYLWVGKMLCIFYFYQLELFVIKNCDHCMYRDFYFVLPHPQHWDYHLSCLLCDVMITLNIVRCCFFVCLLMVMFTMFTDHDI